MDPTKIKIRQAVRVAYDAGYHAGQNGDIYPENAVQKAIDLLEGPSPASDRDEDQAAWDRFAEAALEGMASETDGWHYSRAKDMEPWTSRMARDAADIADAMMAERTKRQGR